jgi:anhydro-N-acetylmuramic acid kinase
MKQVYKIIGLMSGTSLDGLDMAYVHFWQENDRWRYAILCAESLPYSREWQDKLRGAYQQTAEGLTALDAEYGRQLGAWVKAFVQRQRIAEVDFVASHGHTVFHRPELGYNLQIGCGAHLHAVAGLPVVCDFRTLDVACGGQGAPLVPVGDKLLFGQYDYCLNIGGFANVSFDDAAGRRVAYDLCPANYCLNRLMRTRGEEYDRDGRTARSGTVNAALLAALNALEYYHRLPPKSLSQEWVDAHVTPLVAHCGDTLENTVATLTEHAACQIARPFRHGAHVLVTGGGAHNRHLLQRAQQYGHFHWVKPDPITIDFKEALVFAFLGLCRMEGIANCLQSVTGAARNLVSGQVYGGQ